MLFPITPEIQAAEKYDTFMLKHGFVDGFMVGFALMDDWMSQFSSTSIPPAARLNPPLTTIRQDRTELGRSGFYTLHSLINRISISRTMLRPQLIVRQSTGPVRPNAD